MALTPFDYLNEINSGKKDIIVDSDTEKEYNAFMVNKGLGFFEDTARMANVMNVHHHIDKKLQFQFLLNIVRKRKRFSKWFKPEKSSDLDAVKEYYGYSTEKARQALTLLSSEQIDILKKKVYKGGTRK